MADALPLPFDNLGSFHSTNNLQYKKYLGSSDQFKMKFQVLSSILILFTEFTPVSAYRHSTELAGRSVLERRNPAKKGKKKKAKKAKKAKKNNNNTNNTNNTANNTANAANTGNTGTNTNTATGGIVNGVPTGPQPGVNVVQGQAGANPNNVIPLGPVSNNVAQSSTQLGVPVQAGSIPNLPLNTVPGQAPPPVVGNVIQTPQTAGQNTNGQNGNQNQNGQNGNQNQNGGNGNANGNGQNQGQ
ncbi:hypothetical protein HDV06_003601 [Boothiomyces sp. JEL0866]|nr:hypothetical protein HDV06_003601 [Boothiomyces sp. JEL0866]